MMSVMRDVFVFDLSQELDLCFVAPAGDRS